MLQWFFKNTGIYISNVKERHFPAVLKARLPQLGRADFGNGTPTLQYNGYLNFCSWPVQPTWAISEFAMRFVSLHYYLIVGLPIYMWEFDARVISYCQGTLQVLLFLLFLSKFMVSGREGFTLRAKKPKLFAEPWALTSTWWLDLNKDPNLYFTYLGVYG